MFLICSQTNRCFLGIFKPETCCMHRRINIEMPISDYQCCTLQVSLVYINTLEQFPTPFICFKASEHTLWSSDPVLLPTDNVGSLSTARLRTGVLALQPRRCRVMPAAALVEVRPVLSDTRLTQLDPASPVTLQVSAMVIQRYSIGQQRAQCTL